MHVRCSASGKLNVNLIQFLRWSSSPALLLHLSFLRDPEAKRGEPRGTGALLRARTHKECLAPKQYHVRIRLLGMRIIHNEIIHFERPIDVGAGRAIFQRLD